MRDFQRAEYRADAMAAQVAGKRAAASFMNKIVLYDGLMTVTAAKARAKEFTPEQVLPAVEAACQRVAARTMHRRQWTIREETGLYATHPPAGLRAELLDTAYDNAAEVTCTEAESARIDAELATLYEKSRLDVAHMKLTAHQVTNPSPRRCRPRPSARRR